MTVKNYVFFVKAYLLKVNVSHAYLLYVCNVCVKFWKDQTEALRGVVYNCIHF